MASINAVEFSVNGRSYRVPSRPMVVICIDGCGDEYLTAAMMRGRMPHTQAMAVAGYRGFVRCALPTFTNVNNCAIVTGTCPRETGIGGNFIIDPDTGQEVMTNSSRFLRNETILAAASRAGRKVAMVTAKDKLRELLSKGMEGIAFSAEKATDVTESEHGISDVESLVGPAPSIYSADASLYVLRAGVALLESGRSDFLYLSLTDYMQHTYAPEQEAALAFYEQIDEWVGRLLEQGAVLAATADHGMNAKCRLDGTPNVIYLESELTSRFGEGFRVICPITDPYVVHHGALGSAVTVYLPAGADADEIARWLGRLDGITEVYGRAEAHDQLELPADRIGDLFVLSGRDVVVGRRPEDHDLSKLEGTLRSHGGRYEEMVPLLLSAPLNRDYMPRAAADPRNFDVFEFVCNGLELG